MSWERIFGGNPIGVIIRLVILSVIVGIVLATLGIDYTNIFYRIELLIRRIYDLGLGTIEWIFGYFLLGAVIVIPIWLIARLLGVFRNRDGRT